MGSQQQEQFPIEYQAGKAALEGGQYSLSVEHLQKAYQLKAPSSRLGGEVGLWLVSAYQAAGMAGDAIALCQNLTGHPHSSIRQQAKHLLYIIQAPQLKRPPEWMSEIPDLASLAESEPEYRRGSNAPKPKQHSRIELVDLSQVNTKDNQFIWVALGAIILTLLGVFLWGG